MREKLAKDAWLFAIMLAASALFCSDALFALRARNAPAFAASAAKAEELLLSCCMALASLARAAKAALFDAIAGSLPLSAACLNAAKLLEYFANCAALADIAAKAA